MYHAAAGWLLVLGILGASQLIIAKRPDAAELFKKVAPWQGWFGVVSALWGIWNIISALMHLGFLGCGFGGILLFATALGTAVLQVLLGFLFGFGIARSWVKNDQAAAKMDQTLKKIAPYQTTLGVIAILAAAWMWVYILFAMKMLTSIESLFCIAQHF